MSRVASHAGSWYSDNASTLTSQLSGWLSGAPLTATNNVRAIICPHAGYSYSGPVAGHSFKHLQPGTIKRVFVLGPSHHVYMKKCGLTRASSYETPVGNLTIDRKTIAELEQTGQFEKISTQTDEDEHSIEMQLPYIAHIMKGQQFEVVPVMVGHVDHNADVYGRIFAPYLLDPANFFVISSDFCHWGSRFRYTWYDSKHGAIYKSIEWLDRAGMDAITTKDPAVFADYLDKYENTICGRNPISVLLSAIQHSGQGDRFNIQFVKYAQSSACTKQADSSVSYAAGVVTLQ